MMKKTIVRTIETTPGNGPKEVERTINEMEKDGYEFHSMTYCGEYVYGSASNSKRAQYCLFFKKEEAKK